MLSHLINHMHITQYDYMNGTKTDFTYELWNTHNYSIVFKIILTRYTSKWLDSSGSHGGAYHKTRRTSPSKGFTVVWWYNS